MEQILQNPWLIAVLVIWTIPWKAWSLWRSARLGKKGWFIVLLVVNTLGILEMIYLFAVSKKESTVKPANPAVPVM